jgi:hypothetical protein
MQKMLICDLACPVLSHSAIRWRRWSQLSVDPDASATGTPRHCRQGAGTCRSKIEWQERGERVAWHRGDGIESTAAPDNDIGGSELNGRLVECVRSEVQWSSIHRVPKPGTGRGIPEVVSRPRLTYLRAIRSSATWLPEGRARRPLGPMALRPRLAAGLPVRG